MKKWSFRTQLTILIATVFVLGGTTLIVVQYLLVGELLADAIRMQEIVMPIYTADSTVLVMTMRSTSDLVLKDLVWWSIAILAIFAILAIITSSWLSRRSLRRIAQITKTVKTISHQDLKQRLNLAGPTDEIKELGDTMDEMLDRLEESFARQGRFIAAASHELRTPLTIANTALQIPLRQGRVPDDLLPSIKMALRANDRSVALITALLSLARATQASAKTPIELSDVESAATVEPTELEAIIQTSLAEHAAEAAERELTITTDLTGGLVNLDETLVSIAVGNLIENAIRHAPAGSQITLSTGHDDKIVWFETSNGGEIRTEAETAMLVEPFNRGTSTRLTGRGSGLGLTLVDNIARAQGGQLLLKPLATGGLVARLMFPLCNPIA